MKIGLFVIKFLIIGSLFIIANHGLHLSVQSERQTFYEMFFGWFEKLMDQSKTVAGYVTKSEWLPRDERLLAEKIG